MNNDEEQRHPFSALGLHESLVSTVEELGYEEPTPIQEQAIPILLTGRDILGRAATGTGKTAAFALPMVQRLMLSERQATPLALVLVPTRELAVQVTEAISTYGRAGGIRVVAVYGGASVSVQVRQLRQGCDVVVATPGRALDLLSRGVLRLDRVDCCVLDEADEMLDLGFQEDLEAILEQVPRPRQTALFSATFPTRLKRVASAVLSEPVRLDMDEPADLPGEAPRVRQQAYVVDREHKRVALARILDVERPVAALVFCGTRGEVEAVAEVLDRHGYRVEALHGGLGQAQRDRVMGKLRGGTAPVVVATDVAARGIDVEHLSHVINFDLPPSPDQYVHRIGRVGRAGREGVAISLAGPHQQRLLAAISHRVGQSIEVAPVPTVTELHRRTVAQLGSLLRDTAQEKVEARHRELGARLSEELGSEEALAAALAALADALGVDASEDVDIPQLTLNREPSRSRSVRPTPPMRRGWTRLWLSAGRREGIRPGDIFGAVVGEAGLPPKAVGAIQVEERFSLVQISIDEEQRAMSALRHSNLRGRRIVVKRDRGS